MSDIPHINATNWNIAIALFFCLARVTSADSTRPGADETDTLRPGGQHSITLQHRQSVIQCLQIARDAIARKDYLLAVPLLEQVRSEPDSFVPIDASTEVGSHEDVHRLIKMLPTDLRQRLDEQHLASARRIWAQVRTKGPAEVSGFLQQFGALPISVDAWIWLGLCERDRSHFQLAAAAFARASLHQHATKEQRVLAIVAQLETLLLEDKTDEDAIKWLNKQDAKQQILIAGKPFTLGDWLSEYGRRWTAVSTLDSGQPLHSGLGTQICTTGQPVWSASFDPPLGTLLDAREQKQRDQGVRPLQILRPMIIGDQVIVRSLVTTQAFDIATGNCLWKIPNADFRQQWSEDDGYSTRAIESVQRRYAADSIFGRMSTDGNRLFLIHESDSTADSQGAAGGIRNGGISGVRLNKLCCYDLLSGTPRWEIGGKVQSETDPFSGLVFLGSPLVLNHILYAVAQREVSVRLLALDLDTGALLWSMDIGTTLLPIADDLQRSRVACPVVWHEGLLLCSTSAGALVAIDPLLKTMRWGYRYPATTIAVGDLQRTPNQQDAFNGHEPWWDHWREPFAAACRPSPIFTDEKTRGSDHDSARDSFFIFASPETDELHGIHLPDGKPVWRIPRNDGILVAGIDQDVVIVIEGDAVRGHDVSTGKTKWRTQTAELSGAGSLVSPYLMLATQAGGTLTVDIRNGKQVMATPGGNSALGTLVNSGNQWISYSRRSLVRWPQLSEVLQNIEESLKTDPTNESHIVRAASLELQKRDLISSQKRLDGLPISSAGALRHDVLIETLKALGPASPKRGRIEIIERLKEQSFDDERKLSSAIAIATVSLAAGDFASAIDAALDGLSVAPDQFDGYVKAASVNVRKDRFLLGIVDQAYQSTRGSGKTTPEELDAGSAPRTQEVSGEKASDIPPIETLDALFRNRLNLAVNSRDRLAVQRLARQWQGLEWGRYVVAFHDQNALRKRSLLEAELLLLDASDSFDQTTAKKAREVLAQRFDLVSTVQDTAAVSQQTPMELRRKTIPHWPDNEPTADEPQEERTFSVYSMVPAHIEPGCLAENLDIWVERNGNEVLFRGDAFFQSGQDEDHERKFKLPTTASPYRGPVGYMLREAWGVGRAVVLLVGSELFAISPVNDKGEPDSRLLWSNPIELHGSPGDTRIVVGRSGFNTGRQYVIDQLNRQIGKVGPVRPGYFCYCKGAKLVAAETLTGKTLWERLELPPDVVVLGDDHCVLIWHENRTVEMLSPIDGRKLSEYPSSVSPDAILHQRETFVWTLTRNQKRRLELHDLKTGKVVWSRDQNDDDHVCVLDRDTLGVATSDGRLEILDARTGHSICDSLQLDFASLTGITTWHDSERWFVALTRPLGEGSPWRSIRPSESYRRAFVNGVLVAIDRRQPRVLWSREMIDEPISLDQSRVAPVFMQAWKFPIRGNSGVPEGGLRAIDKRTGKILVDRRGEAINPHFLLNPDLEQGILELKLPREMIRLRYSHLEIP